MDQRIKNDLRIVSALVKPTPEAFARLIDGWERYMEKVPPEQQYADFCAVIQARVEAGSISIVAPDFLEGVSGG